MWSKNKTKKTLKKPKKQEEQQIIETITQKIQIVELSTKLLNNNA